MPPRYHFTFMMLLTCSVPGVGADACASRDVIFGAAREGKKFRERYPKLSFFHSQSAKFTSAPGLAASDWPNKGYVRGTQKSREPEGRGFSIYFVGFSSGQEH